MPTRNVNLTRELDRFVHDKIESGRYENASEVVRAALRSLERDEEEYEARLATLRVAIDEGDASGFAKGDVFARVRNKLKLTASASGSTKGRSRPPMGQKQSPGRTPRSRLRFAGDC
jgi:antitoxin ParD1/3/4